MTTCSAYALHAVLQEFDIDTERLPLGTLSKDQVQRGYDVLERLRSALGGSGHSLERLSSEFYQVTVSMLHQLACFIHVKLDKSGFKSSMQESSNLPTAVMACDRPHACTLSV